MGTSEAAPSRLLGLRWSLHDHGGFVVSGGRSKFARMTREDRLLVVALVSSGVGAEEAGAAVGCTARSVNRLVVALGGVRARKRPRSPRRLSLEDREEIRAGLGAGASFAAIAGRIGRCPSTVSREVNRNGGRRRYRAVAADGAA
jgi:transposase, IS30 family